MRGILCLFLLVLLNIFRVSAQTDTEFWFAVPKSIPSSGATSRDRPIFLRIMAVQTGVTNVRIYCPANPSLSMNVPIDAAVSRVQSVELTTWLDNLICKTPDAVLNTGLKIEADQPITVYFDQASNANPEMFALKGRNALGTSFYIPGQTTYNNDGRNFGAGNGEVGANMDSIYGYNSFDIVATEDNTQVTIRPSKDIIGHTAGTAFSVILNKGQTFSCRAVNQSKTSHLGGSVVASSKPVAVTMKDDFLNVPGGGSDLIGDQLVPVGLLGTEYISTNGYFSDKDRACIMAVQDNTSVWVNGSLVTTLNAGQSYEYPYTSGSGGNPVYIKSSSPVSVMHLTGAGTEMGSAVLPPIGGCTGSSEVGIVRPGSDQFYLIILVPKTSAGEESKFTFNGGTANTTIKAQAFSTVPGNTGWQYAKIELSTSVLGAGQPAIIRNTAPGVTFHLGIIYATSSGASYGYFSNYGRYNPVVSSNGPICENTKLELFGSLSTSQSVTYNWTGPLMNPNDPASAFTSNAQNPVIDPFPLPAGKYTFTCTVSSQGCFSSTQNVDVTVNPNPTSAPQAPAAVCEGSQLLLTGNAVTGASYSWTGPQGSNFSSTLQSPAIDPVTLANSGTYALQVTLNGCAATKQLNVLVNARPQPTVKDLSSCASSPVNLLTAITNQDASSNYAFTDQNGTAVAQPASVTQSGTYYVQATATSTQCVSAPVPVNVTLYPLPVVEPINGPSSLCQGQTATLSSATADGIWSSSNEAVATVDAAGKVSALSAGTAVISYTVTSTQQCVTTVTHSITVQGRPVVEAINGAAALCVNGTTVLTDGTPGGAWSSSNTLIATIGSDGTVLGKSAGNTTISYTVVNGNFCSTVVTKDLVVYALPVVADIGGPSSLCANSSVVLTDVTPGGTWSSSNTAVATIGTNGTVLGKSAGNTTISYTVVNENHCSTVVTKNILVYAAPVVANISGPSDLCVNGSASLTEATAGGVWASSNPTVASVDANGYVVGKAAGQTDITYTVTNANLCSTTATQTITVHALPQVANIIGPSEVCAGNAITLTETTADGQWFSTNVNIASVNQSGQVTAKAPGSVTISYFVVNEYACTASVTHVVKVNPLPVVAGIDGPGEVCVNSTVVLSNATAGGFWSSENNTIAEVDANGVVTGKQDGTVVIDYTVTNTQGCSVKVTKSIVVHALPAVAAITGPGDVCVGGTIDLANATADGIWTTSDNTIAEIGADGKVTGKKEGTVTISYTVTNNYQCSAVATATVQVHALPEVTAIAGPADVCVGATVDLTDATTGGAWSSSGNTIAEIDANGKLAGKKEGIVTISYTVTNNYQCSTVATKTIQVHALPEVAAIAGPADVCVDGTIEVTNTTTGGTWSSSDNTIAEVDVNGKLTGKKDGIVTISYTVANNYQCSTVVTKTIQVHALPEIAAIAGPADVCVGGTIEVTNTTTGGTWSSSDNTIADVDANGKLIGKKDGTVTINYTVVNNYQCSAAATKTIQVHALPVVAPIAGPGDVCVDGTINLTDATAGGAWNSSDNTIAEIDASGKLTGKKEGAVTISYTVTSNYQCNTTVTTDVRIHALPQVAAIAGPGDVCVGGTIDVTNATAGGTWSSSDNTVAEIDINGKLTGKKEGVVTISYTVANNYQCSAVVTATIQVHALPEVAAIVGPADICVGGIMDVTNATAGGTWSSSDNTVAEISTDGKVTGKKEGIVTIAYTVTNNYQCGVIATKTIQVHALPEVAAIGGPGDVCVGAAIDLTDATPGGTWSSSDNAIAEINTDGKLTGKADGMVTIRYTVANNYQCATVVTKTIYVHALPQVEAITGPADLCVNGTVDVTSATANGSWSSSDNTIAEVDANGKLTGKKDGIVTINYTVVNNYQCSAAATKTIQVHALPVVAPIAGPGDVCVDGAIDLTNATAGGTWSSSDNTIAEIDAAGKLTGKKEGTVTIGYSVTNNYQCNTLITATIRVHALPEVAPIAGPGNVCVGGTIDLTNATTGGTWSSSDNTVAEIDANGKLAGKKEGVVTIGYTVVNSSQCSTVATTSIQVHALPEVAAITGPGDVCVGGTVDLANATINGTWSSSDNTIAVIDANGKLTGKKDGTAIISYTVVNNSQCSAAVTKPVQVHALPEVAAITGPADVCVGATIDLTNATTGGTWSSNDNTIAEISTDGKLTGKKDGAVTISYTITNNYQCNAAVTATIQVHALPEVAAIAGPEDVCVGGTIDLTDATANGSWLVSDNAIASIDANGKLSGKNDGTVTVSYTVANNYQCNASAIKVIRVHALPEVAAIAGLADVCVGATIDLTNAARGGTWNSSDNTIAEISTDGKLTGKKEGGVTITYTVTNSNQCSNTVTKTIQVHALPEVEAITGPADVCVGGTVDLTDATKNGTWSSSDNTIAGIDVNGRLTGKKEGTVTIYYTVVNNSQCAATAAKIVQVHALPEVAGITGPGDVCVGGTIDLTDATAGGTWNSSDNTIAEVDVNGKVTGKKAGAATMGYTVINNNQCVATVTKIVQVHALPEVAAIAGPGEVCVGGTIDLTDATANGTWSSNDNTIAEIDASGKLTAKTGGTVIISYTVTNNNQCNAAVTKTIQVHALPQVAAITGPGDVCVGGTIELTNATANGTWSSNDNTIAEIDASGKLTAKSEGTVIINYTVTNNNQCSAAVTKTIQVHALPLVAAITGPGDVCVGASVILANATANGTWNSSDKSIAEVGADGKVAGKKDGTVTINYTVTNSNQCSNTVAKTIQVHALPEVTAIAGPADVCVGVTIDLTDATANGVWSSSDNTIAGINASGRLTGKAEGAVTVSYTVTNNDQCSGTVTKLIQVHALPEVAAIAGPADVCVGGSIDLTDATVNGTWSSSDNTIAELSASGHVTGKKEGAVTISYTVVNNNQCNATVTKMVQVHALPEVAAIEGPGDVCAGGTIDLTDATANGTWSSSDNTIAEIDAHGKTTGKKEGIITASYTVTNNNGCIVTVTKTIGVHALPEVAAITGPADVCVNETIVLADATTGGIWASSDNTIAAVDASGMVTGKKDGAATITYTVTNNNQCSAAVTKTIQVHALPEVAAITGPGDVCVNGTIELANATTGGTWAGSNDAIDAGGKVTAKKEGAITVSYTVTNSSQCSVTVTKVIQVHALPDVAVITGPGDVCAGGTIALTDVTVNGVWSSNDEAVAKVDNNGIVTGVKEGNVTIAYTVTNSNGCSVTVTKNIAVHALPVIAPVTGVGEICTNGTALFTDATPGGSWSSGDNTIAGIDAAGLLTAKAPGSTTISYTLTSPYGCTSTLYYAVTVKPLPALLGQHTFVVCSNSVFDYTPQSSVPSTTFSWQRDQQEGIANAPASGKASPMEKLVNTGNAAATATYHYLLEAGGCSSNANVTVVVQPVPDATITGTTMLCAGQPVLLTAAGTLAGTTFKWINETGSIIGNDAMLNTTSPSNGVAALSYTLVAEKDGCAAPAKPITVQLKPVPVVSVSGTGAVCARSELRLTASSSLEAVQYIWKNSAGQLLGTGETYLLASAEAGNSGSYTLTASKDGCVSAPVSYTVTVKPLPEIEISTLGVFCQNTTVEMKASSSLPGTRFEWMADNGNETTGQSIKIAGLNGDSVRCTVTARNNGCSTQKKVVLPVKKTPRVELNPIGPLCQNAGFTRFTAMETTGLPGKGAFSGPGINAGGYFNPSAAAGTYTITYRYTTTDGCYDEKTTDVKVYPVPAVNAGPDLVMYEGKSVKLEGSVSGLYQSFQWQPAETGMPGNLLQPVVHPRTSTTYRLTATTEQGCTAFDEVNVKVLKFRIPNAFSPNGDGINDKWVIEGLSHFSNCLVEIYNRWGTLLYRSQGYNTPWDGTYKGQPVPVGTYYYLINLNDGLTKEPVAGWVEVLH